MRKPLTPKAKRRLLGLGQDLLILVLVVSAVMLGGGSGLLDFAGDISGGVLGMQSGQNQGGQKEYTAAAEPLSMMLTPEAGAHCGVMYSQEELYSAYDRFSATLAEALGSSGEPEQISEEEWRAALNETGVFFDFYCDFQLSSLAIWLGTEINGPAAGHTARRICISLDNGLVWLNYVRSRDEGGFYRCSTSVQAGEFAARVGESIPNGAEFVFELSPTYDALDPYTVLMQGSIVLGSISGENSLRSADSEALYTAFGLSSYLASTYPESDGTLVSVEGEATLRLGADGELKYSFKPIEDESAPKLSPTDAIELARRLVENTAGRYCGEASLRLSYIYLSAETGEYTICFDYVYDGVPLRISGREHAVEITVTGERVTYASILFRSYESLGGREEPLPANLAAALLQTEGGGELRLYYTDNLEKVTTDWKKA